MLNGTTIHLRALEPEDLDLLYIWENNPAVWKVSGTMVPFSKKQLKLYIKTQGDIYTDRQLRLVIGLNETSQPVGLIDLFDFDPHHRRAGVGILLAEEEFRGQGVATESLTLLVEHAFHTLGMHQLYCNILEGNDASFKLFESAGFERIGFKKDWIRHQNEWCDEHMLALINN